MRRDVQGVLLALAAALLFGLVNVAARASTVPPLVMSAYAYLLAGILLAPTLRGVRIGARDRPKVAAIALLGGALAPALLFYGLQRARASDASILLTLEMVFTAILAALFLRERVRPRAWLGVVLLFVGALLMALRTASASGETTLVGAGLVAAAALGWGVDNTLSAKLVGSYKPHQLLALKGLLGGAAGLAAALLVSEPLRVAPSELRNIAYIGILGVGASVLLFYHALRQIGATLTSSVFLPATALAGVMGAALLLGENLTRWHVLALGLAVSGVLLVSRPGTSRG